MQCPSCHKEVDVKAKDVGALFTCPQCRSVYFINFDGTPEYGEVEPPSEEELKKLQNASIPEKKKKKKKKKDDEDLEQHEVESLMKPEQTNSGANEPSRPVAFEMEVPPVDIPQTETPAFEMQPMENFAQQEAAPTETFSLEPAPETFQVAPEEPPIEALPTESPSIENFSYEATPANENQSQSQETSSVALQDFSSIASEIESFGNQQTVVAGISYDLEITGLDTKESQELLREAIDDSRFGWHPDDIVREIRRGSCTFKNLTPVQAFVLARRIQFIDMEMKWKQNVLA